MTWEQKTTESSNSFIQTFSRPCSRQSVCSLFCLTRKSVHFFVRRCHECCSVSFRECCGRSHVTASSSSASCSSFSSLVSGHVSTNIVVHGLSLATITGRSFDKTPSVQICTAWALACLETVEQRPCVTREIETWFCANETVIES